MNQVSNDRKIFREYFTQAMHGQTSKELLSVVSQTIHSLAADNPSELSLADTKIKVQNLKEKDLLIFTQFAKDVLKSSAIEEAEGEQLLQDIEQIQRNGIIPNKQLISMKRHILLNEHITAPKGEGIIDTATTNLVNAINQKQTEVKELKEKLPKQQRRDIIIAGLALGGTIALTGVIANARYFSGTSGTYYCTCSRYHSRYSS